MMQNALTIAARSSDVFALSFYEGIGIYGTFGKRSNSYGKMCTSIKSNHRMLRAASSKKRKRNIFSDLANAYINTPQNSDYLYFFAPTMYLLEDSWYKIMPKPTLSPTIMKPSTKPSWKYIPGALEYIHPFHRTSGIYSQTDLEELKDHIIIPVEQLAILNTMTKGILGRSIVINEGSFSNPMNEASIERIAISAWEKFWNKFFCLAISAGLIEIYLIARIIKLLLDTFVHGYTLCTIGRCIYWEPYGFTFITFRKE